MQKALAQLSQAGVGRGVGVGFPEVSGGGLRKERIPAEKLNLRARPMVCPGSPGLSIISHRGSVGSVSGGVVLQSVSGP